MPYTRMRYHFVTATKKREPWLTERPQQFMRGVMAEKAEELGGEVICAGGIEDHEHLVASVPASIAPADFIGKLKAESSRRIQKAFPSLEDFAWQKGYGGFTLWPARMQRVLEYVENQESYHRRGTTWEELEKVK